MLVNRRPYIGLLHVKLPRFKLQVHLAIRFYLIREMTYEVEFSQYVRQLSSLYCVDLDDNLT